MQRPLRLAAGVLAGMLALGACGGERANNASNNGNGGGRLAIATGNTTGVFYVLGGGYAQVINKNLPGYRATAEATGASVENVQRVVSGQSDIALCTADVAFDAVSGNYEFSSKQPIKALARIYSNHVQVVVRNDSGINSIEDMKGKKVSTGSPKSGTELLALRLLQAGGLDPDKDINRQKFALTESVDGMKKGSTQAIFWSGGIPTPGITDVFTTMKGKVHILDLSSYLPKLQAKFPNLYSTDSIPKSAYNTDSDTPSLQAPNLIIVRDTMSNDLAEKLTALLFDHQADLIKVHKEAKNYNLKTAQETPGVPLHPGATTYYNAHKSG
jgi:TRAP transporter TAXI family solute receptor